MEILYSLLKSCVFPLILHNQSQACQDENDLITVLAQMFVSLYCL